jgi:hypothetical protein
MKEPMKTRTRTAGLGLSLLLATGVAGCGGASGDDGVATASSAKPKPTATSSSSSGKLSPKDAQAAALRFAKCMRANGLPNFEDPKVTGGGLAIALPDGVSPEKADKANQKCKKYLPNGGVPPKLDPQELERQRQFAKCMRANGVPDFPDPQANGGGIRIDKKSGSGGPNAGTSKVGPGNPTFDKAQRACAKYQPKGGLGGTMHQVGPK